MDPDPLGRERTGRGRRQGLPSTEPTPLSDSGTVFLGRERELSELSTGLEHAFAGHSRLFLLSGEPGIGKSRLADTFATRAVGRGAAVVWGRCWEAGGAPAYWPWTQGLRACLRDLTEEVRSRVRPLSADLAQLLPELGDTRPGTVPETPADPEAARFRQFDAAASFLRDVAASRPLVFVIDDLHAADAPSLLLLRFLTREVGDARLLLLATYRDVGLTPDQPLNATLPELAREPMTRKLTLTGLSESDVARFIELVTGVEPSLQVVTAVHGKTEGNPLFVGELARLLASEDRLQMPGEGPIAVPQSVRQTIDRRLERLGEECRRLLSFASVLGREFGVDAVRELDADRTSDVLEMLEEALHEGVIVESHGSLGRLHFSHALVRDALYEALPVNRRVQLHAAAGEGLERLHGSDPGPHLAELAHHFVEASPAGDQRRALAYARAAGDWALVRLAYEEAVRLYRMALRVLDLGAPGDRETRCDLLISLGEALLRAGEADQAKESFLTAADLAREAGLGDRLARAALGYGGRFVWLRPAGDVRLVPLLRESIEALPQGDSDLRVRVLSRLAGALRDDPDRSPRDALTREAVEMARRTGDPAALSFALVARYTAIWGPDNTRELLDIANEVFELAERAGDPNRVLEARLIRHKALMTLGEVSAVRTELEAATRLAEELGQPSQLWFPATDRATLALFEGRFGEAELLIGDAYRLGERSLGPMEAVLAFRLQMFQLRKEQGRLEEMERDIRVSVHTFPGYRMLRCVLANMCAVLGHKEEGRVTFEELARDGFSFLPLDNEWLFGMSFLPEVARLLGDSERATMLYKILRPFGDLNAYSAPELCTGPISRYLGMLASIAERYDEAVGHYEEAIEATGRMGARPWGAHARKEYAEVLLERDAPGDAERASALLEEAGRTALELGMTALGASVSELRKGGAAVATVVGLEAAHTLQPAVFRREGDYWSVAFEGRVLRLKDAKGLRYLHRLIGNPRREFHVAELVALGSDGRGGGPGSGAAERSPAEALGLDSGHAGEILDARAKSEYARRIEELEADEEEAVQWGDSERAALAREEIDLIARQLAEAYGLGGRARRAADTVERMRKAVTNRIRDAISRVERENPQLGRHLANAVTTGIFCSYTPDRAIDWNL